MAIPEEEDVLPWKETSVESERLQFIERHAAGEETVAELCRRFGISRKTDYKLIGRYEAYGEGGLLDLNRAPHYHPNATPTQVAGRIVEAKRRRPTWGPKKVVAWLRSIRARRALAVPQHGERHTGSCGSGEASQAAA